MVGEQPWTVMCAYNRVNGIPAAEHHWLLTEVLRDEWGFEGAVISDWGAVDAIVPAIAAGLDLEMPGPQPEGLTGDCRGGAPGRLHESTLDARWHACAGSWIGLRRRLGDPVDYDAIAMLGARAARGLRWCCCATRAAAPAHPSRARLAVIGEFARTPRFQGAGKLPEVNPTRVDDRLDELRAASPTAWSVDVRGRFALAPPTSAPARASSRGGRTAADRRRCGRALPGPAGQRRVRGLRPRPYGPASRTRSTLLEAVAAVQRPGGRRPSRTGRWWPPDPGRHHAGAILEGWLGGQAGRRRRRRRPARRGRQPLGRLAETIPVRLQDTSRPT